MSDIDIRVSGRAGRITLNRPKALNALTYDMAMAIEAALDNWRGADIDLIVIDAMGDKAFCAGGDIEDLYNAGKSGDYAFGQTFWRDEYRMNHKMARFPKPVVALMQGFTMGGGVGVGCHGSHRIVGDSSQIAMPECGIGLIPDVGGSLLLARAPGRLGEYLGLTTARMGAGDAIHCGFADYYIPEEGWPALIARLEETGDMAEVDRAAAPAPQAPLAAHQAEIDAHFAGEKLGDIYRGLPDAPSEFMAKAVKAMSRVSPLSAACTVEILHRVRAADDIAYALEQEYRFTYRALEHGDFVEGIRAAIIDKDRAPNWKYTTWEDVPPAQVLAMTTPLGDARLRLEEQE
ncbi:MAG: enoyl-CoA hydratase [Rhodobacterales bacterium]|nr:MAG: enoyl-CoA hydratase [Rhodobacterales bacterium]